MKDKIPTTVALLFFSWAFVIFGVLLGGYFIILGFSRPGYFIIGPLVLFAGLLSAVLTRMLGNIGQMLFEIRASIEQVNCDSKDINQNTHQIKTFFEQIERHLGLKK